MNGGLDDNDKRTAVDQLETFLANVDHPVDQNENTETKTNDKALSDATL